MNELLFAIAGSVTTGFVGVYFARHKAESEWRHRLQEAESEWEQKLSQCQKEFDDFRRGVTYYEDLDHLMVLDGPANAGKSALVARWTSPSADVSRIRKTAGLAEVHHFLCSEHYKHEQLACERRHRLRYMDIPGERAADIVAAFDEVKPKFIVIVVDPDDLEGSFDRHSADRLTFVYMRRDIREALRGVLIYISKSDKYPNIEYRRWLYQQVDGKVAREFRSKGIEPYIFHGSAYTGEELVNAMGFIVEKLGLRPFFPRHASL